jgi:ATP-dependent protease ClpP protease subunit
MNLKMEKRNDSAEVYIYDEISEWGITAREFTKQLLALGDVKSLTVRINSPGGAVFDAIAIHNAIARHPAKVKAIAIDGMAFSAASLIAMAAPVRRMAKNAEMMIHDPWSFAVGSAADMRDMAAMLDQVKGNLADTYSSASGMGVAEVEQIMSDETWLTAAQAKSHGFVTDITDPVEMSMTFDRSRFKFKHAPERLLARSEQQDRPRANVAAIKIAAARETYQRRQAAR